MSELHVVLIFCEKKSETVAKHRINQSKITLFRLAIPKMSVLGGMGILVFFGVWGPFRPPNSAKLFLAGPITAPQGKKKVRKIYFFDRQWVQTPAKPRFIEIEIEKSRFLIRKKSTPNYPEIC